jgi:precorrin-2 dehydrogenase/sirohydrochlorin ferrochelatase
LKYYPIYFSIKNKSALVVGAGTVAQRKIKQLLTCGAKVKIVSPSITPGLKKLHLRHKIKWVKRKAQSHDLKGVSLAIVATNDTFANKTVSKWAKKQNIPVNVVDNAKLSDFISPAFFNKGKAVVTVSTNAKDPALSRDLKNFLKEHWDDFLSYRHKLQNRKP